MSQTTPKREKDEAAPVEKPEPAPTSEVRREGRFLILAGKPTPKAE